ncbi:DUF2285 domain-containing protein [Rhizobium leguminosarum bv. viciae]|nr:DUF2285 domain-containing protein [Rhizobium leguminosarum]TBZ19268.1 DUF2285 domain-containing protein [Rhizobium leguminosarum bv. viciae]
MSHGNSLNNGGCDFAAAPGKSALLQPIFWTPQTDPATLPFRAGPSPAGDFSVRVDDLQAHAIVEHDAALIRLALRGEPYDVVLADADDRRPLGAFVMFDELTPDRLIAIERLWQAMFGKRVPPDPRLTPQRRHRARLMLRVFDARLASASYRKIAEQLFPNLKHDAATWVESPVRITIARLARDGMSYVRGGYRTLLRRPRRSR